MSAKIPDPGPVLDLEASEDLLHSSTCLHLEVKGFVFILKLYKSTHICCKKKKQDFKKKKNGLNLSREHVDVSTQAGGRR